MKQKILKTLALGLLLVGGVNGAWADGITPTLDVFFRTNNANDGWNTNKYNNKSYPIKGSDAGDIEFAAHHSARMFVLQKYTVEHLDAVKSLTLTLTGSSGTDALAIWAFDTNDWTESTTASTLASKVESIVGLALGSTSGSANTTYLKNQQNTKTEVATGINACTFVISGTALETLKANASDNTFTLLITNKVGEITTGSDRKFYSSGHSTESYRPYIEVSYFPVAIGENYYETLNAAVTAAAEGAEISILRDCEVSSKITFNKSLTITPASAGITIKRSTSLGSNQMFLLATGSKTVNIGALTIDGQSTTSDRALIEVTNGQLNLTNTTILNAYTSNAQGVVCAKSSGKVKLTGVAFNGCQATATDAGIVFCGINDGIILSGDNAFTDCTGYDMYLERRFQVDETNGVTNTTPITIFVKTSNIALGGVVATKVKEDEITKFIMRNNGYGLFKKSGDTRNNMQACEGYTLDVTSAGASTLVLPFESTIPSGITCYTLNYTSGASSVTATPVSTTLPANTPVLVNGSEGSYSFVNSSKSTTATSYETSAKPTDGALTGVYEETTPGIGYYILTNHSSSVGFRKTVATSKVAAYRAYLSAASEAREFLDIDFSDGNVTAIKNVKVGSEDHVYYDLQGRRVLYPKKGLYIVNGKKVIIK